MYCVHTVMHILYYFTSHDQAEKSMSVLKDKMEAITSDSEDSLAEEIEKDFLRSKAEQNRDTTAVTGKSRDNATTPTSG